MGAQTIILLLCGVCLLWFLITMFPEAAKAVIRMGISGVSCLALACVLNLILPGNLYIGLNPANFVLTSALGLPGLAAMYIFLLAV